MLLIENQNQKERERDIEKEYGMNGVLCLCVLFVVLLFSYFVMLLCKLYEYKL